MSDEELEINFLCTKFLLENRLPFSTITALQSFLKVMSQNFKPDTIQAFTTSRQTVTKVTKSISQSIRKKLFSQLKCSPFSLSIDPGSDLYGSAYLSVSARFIDSESPEEVVTRFLSIIPITTESTGLTLFNHICTNILYDPEVENNFVGICSDDAPNLMGVDQGACYRLQKKNFLELSLSKILAIYITKSLRKLLKVFQKRLYLLSEIFQLNLVTVLKELLVC